MEPLPPPEEVAELARHLPEVARFGTSSWTYPGWQGLIYHRKYPRSGAAARMLEEYAAFPLFRTVGIDSTFYAPASAATLQNYARALPPAFPCVSKVWDRITVHTFPAARYKSSAGEENPDFLNAELFQREVLDPCLEHFADHLGPMVFEFQTISRKAGLHGQAFADRLDRFFAQLPRGLPYAVELRNADYLVPPYFAVLREHNVAHVFNSWTRMPSVGEQLALPGSISAPFIVARILLRPGRTYSDAVDAFAPYDRIQDENPELRHDAAELIRQAMLLKIPAYLVVNNRAEGSAPHTILGIARLLAADPGVAPPVTP